MITDSAATATPPRSGTRRSISTNGGRNTEIFDRTEKILYDRLAAYENAGLLPEEVEVLFHRSKRDNVVIPDVTFFGKPLEHWDEIDKAEIEGRLVILPCKVGDKVWFDTWEHGIKNVGIRPHKIDRVDITIVTNINELVFTNIPLQELGETVFLTREEAEKALKAN